jgi:peptidoglycan/LPS O-acetylase OafA/YrhL
MMTQTDSQSERTYFPELDGLRFVAFVLVFIHHAPLLKHVLLAEKLREYGWMGVDLFLCLSAFLFTRLLSKEYRQTGELNVWYFYIRRGLRIWPAYFVFILITIIFSIIKNQPPETIRLFGLITFTDNIFTAVSGYTLIMYSSHLWTIAYEEQFYAVIPWVLKKLFVINVVQRRRFFGVAILIGLIIRGLLIYFQIPHPAVWVLPVSHFDSIMVGLLIGTGDLDQFLRKIPKPVLAGTGILALFGVCVLPNVNIISWLLMLTYPLVGIGWGLVLYIVLNTNTAIQKVLAFQPIRFLGKISYGLYLYHLLGISFFGNLMMQSGLKINSHYLNFFLPFIFTIIVSMLSYFIIEKPFLKMKDKYTIIASRPI